MFPTAEQVGIANGAAPPWPTSDDGRMKIESPGAHPSPYSRGGAETAEGAGLLRELRASA